MPWWHERSDWRAAIEPFFDAVGVSSDRVVRCLLAKLPPGTTIPVHHDTVILNSDVRHSFYRFVF